MKKLIALALSCIMAISFVACSSEPTTEEAGLKDGIYTGYFPQATYLAKADVTVENGAVTGYAYEECHLPNYWATFTEDEVASLTEADYISVEGTRGITYFAKNIVIGTGDETVYLTTEGVEAGTYNGTTYLVYGNDEIADFAEYVKDAANAEWYYNQLYAGNYWLADAEGNVKEDLAVYSSTRKDGVVLDKTDCRMKTTLMHWTAVGTGVGTEFGELGWNGNLTAIGDFLLENNFPEGEFSLTDEGKVAVADLVSTATINEYAGYLQMFYDAYNQAK